MLCALVCRNADGKFAEQKLLIGTHTSDGVRNALMIARVRLPLDSPDMKDVTDGGSAEEFGSSLGKFEIIAQVDHEEEVNRSVSFVVLRPCP